METITVSPKYQVVIPQIIRKIMGIRPGEKMQVVRYENRIELIPRKSLTQMRGFLKGLDTNIPKEKDRL